MIVKVGPNPAPYGQRRPASIGKDIVAGIPPTIGGLALGAPAAYLGAHLGKEAASYLMSQGPRWVLQGAVSPRTAIDLLPYVRDQAFATKVGAISLGLAGFALGAYLLWPRES
jgi:hypothetical protein